MTLEWFKTSLSLADPPDGISAALQALWYDGKSDWSTAHDIAQDIHTRDGSWIHAYLHRKEGDQSNAAYWYRQAGKPVCTFSLAQEWEEIAAELLQRKKAQ